MKKITNIYEEIEFEILQREMGETPRGVIVLSINEAIEFLYWTMRSNTSQYVDIYEQDPIGYHDEMSLSGPKNPSRFHNIDAEQAIYLQKYSPEKVELFGSLILTDQGKEKIINEWTTYFMSEPLENLVMTYKNKITIIVR